MDYDPGRTEAQKKKENQLCVGSDNVAPRPAASVSPDSLLEMHIPKLPLAASGLL